MISPYTQRVVALIDAPADPESHTVQELEGVLGDRLIRLDEASLEESIPEDIYERVGLTRTGVLDEIKGTADYRVEHDIKRRVSREISRALVADDVDRLPRIKAAVELALERAGTAEAAPESPAEKNV